MSTIGSQQGGQVDVPPMDTQNLATIVLEWRRIQDELVGLRQQTSEKNKRAKILEGIILNIMKQNNMGALDLKSSGARILYEQKQTKITLNPKTLQKLLTEHMKDETKAAEAVQYISEHREGGVKDKLKCEKL